MVRDPSRCVDYTPDLQSGADACLPLATACMMPVQRMHFRMCACPLPAQHLYVLVPSLRAVLHVNAYLFGCWLLVHFAVSPKTHSAALR